MKHLIPILCLAVGLVTGCGAISKTDNLSGWERAIYNVETNWVTNIVQNPVEVWKTNTVTSYTTNTVGVVVTNTQVEFKTLWKTNTVTNVVSLIGNMTPKDGVTEDVQALSQVAGNWWPGAEVAGGILIGLLALWGKLRKAKTAGAVLAQDIEAIRTFIRTLPDGAKYDEALVQWMREHQTEAGAVKEVVSILEKYVDSTDAKVGAREIKAAIDALG